MTQSSKLRQTQDPLVRSHAVKEAVSQALVLLGLVGLFQLFDFSFEVSVLLLLVAGFSLVTLNIMSSTVSQNIHLAEIRDALLDHSAVRGND